MSADGAHLIFEHKEVYEEDGSRCSLQELAIQHEDEMKSTEAGHIFWERAPPSGLAIEHCHLYP